MSACLTKRQAGAGLKYLLPLPAIGCAYARRLLEERPFHNQKAAGFTRNLRPGSALNA
jgi:hypothetical protein